MSKPRTISLAIIIVAVLGTCLVATQAPDTSARQASAALSPQITAGENSDADRPVPTAVPDPPKGEESPSNDPNQAAKSQPAQSKDPKSQDVDKPTPPPFYPKTAYVLKTYVDADGQVDYNTLRRMRLGLVDAVKEYSGTEAIEILAMSRNERIAFWINAHNIFTLKLIIDEYPIQPRALMSIFYPKNSIMQLTEGRDKKFFSVQGLEYTLQEIETDLHNRFSDPRICFALSYATRGGGILRNEPYYPDKLDRQLDEQVAKFLSGQHGIRADADKQIIYLSNIFNINKALFARSKYAAIKKFRHWKQPHFLAAMNFISQYAPNDYNVYFNAKDYTVKYIPYDWHLNEQYKSRH